MKNFYLFISFLLCIHLLSCKGKNKGLESIFSSSNLSQEEILNALNSDKDSVLLSIYDENGNNAFWVNQSLKDKDNIIEQLSSLENDGINTEDFGLNELKQRFEQKDKLSNTDLAKLEIDLSKAYLKAANNLTFGVINPLDVDSEWHASNDKSLKIYNYYYNGDLKHIDSFRPKNPRYSLMSKSLAKWKSLENDSTYLSLKKNNNNETGANELASYILKYLEISTDTSALGYMHTIYKINPDNEINSTTARSILNKSPKEFIALLKINMERMRWLPNDFKDEYIWANIPNAHLDYYKKGKNVFHTRTIVGAKSTRTPTILDTMENIVVNPPWTVPYSIVKNEMRGRVSRKYKVYGRNGKEVSRGAVNMSNYTRYTIRQPAGPSSALGFLKFNLPNQWHIYLHDTPNRNLFQYNNRYKSHGCVRVQDPRMLASLIFEEQDSIKNENVDSLIAKNKTQAINTHPIYVYIVYMTANADKNMNHIIFSEDIYGKDEALKAKLRL